MKWLTTTTSLSFHCAHRPRLRWRLSICELCTPPKRLISWSCYSAIPGHISLHMSPFSTKKWWKLLDFYLQLGFQQRFNGFFFSLDPISKTSRYLRLGGMAGVSFFWPMAKMMISTEKTSRPFKGRCHFLFETAEMLVFRLCKTFIQW